MYEPDTVCWYNIVGGQRLKVVRYLHAGFYLVLTVPQGEERIVPADELTVVEPKTAGTNPEQPGFPAAPIRKIEQICGLPRS